MCFCIETAYRRASKLLSWVALWAPGFVRASVRARTGGCGSGSSLSMKASDLNNQNLIHASFSEKTGSLFYTQMIVYSTTETQEMTLLPLMIS
jgi:hypothetical protein